MVKAYMFIDGANIFHVARSLQMTMSYEKLVSLVKELTLVDEIRPYYYTAMLPSSDIYNAMQPLVDWLEYNGFRVVTKPATKHQGGGDQGTVIKGNMDTDMVVDMLRLAPYYDVAVLISSDGDFVPVVRYLQDIGKTVVVVASDETGSNTVSGELKKCADRFLDVSKLKAQLSR